MHPLIVANWKMQLTVREAVRVAMELRHELRDVPSRLALCPSFTALSAVSQVLRGTHIALGAQNLAATERGAFSGEVSALDLRLLGCRYVIVGHSDRRRMGETDAVISQKVALAVRTGLTPILCVGETRTERRQGRQASVVGRQVLTALSRLPRRQWRSVLITYEPIWAISPGGPIGTPSALAMADFIRRTLRNEKQVLLYGGSVSPRNVSHFLDGQHFSGALIGQASLRPASLRSLLTA